MKFLIPAKTFLIGEYVALNGGPAILLNTSPCFELSIVKNTGNNLAPNNKIHPKSPAGKFLSFHNIDNMVSWYDPFNGLGGLGGSSAEFVGAYLAYCYFNDINPKLEELLESYFRCLDSKGTKPSGYDVIAQTLNNCVYINQNNNNISNYFWPFQDISFALFHTGTKIKTHSHLKNFILPEKSGLDNLLNIIEIAHQAFITYQSDLLIKAIKLFHEQLLHLNLIATHTMQIINYCCEIKEILAVKGCGALGADIILVLFEDKNREKIFEKLTNSGLFFIGSNLYTGRTLIKL